MRVVIVGGGLLGITSSYFLAQRGHEVVLLDKNSGLALEASFANGALLTPSMSEPWNSPGCWRVLLGSVVRADSPLQLSLRAVPGLLGWGASYLSNSRRAYFQRNALSNLTLSLHSLKVMEDVRSQVGIAYDHESKGSLRIFRDHSALGLALVSAERLQGLGLRSRGLSAAEVTKLEPALAPIEAHLAGGIHYSDDEVGNAYLFCRGLGDWLQQHGVEMLFGSAVHAFEMGTRGVESVLVGKERLSADYFVIAAGSDSTRLLRSAGIRLPVQPAKGYSLTFNAASDGSRLQVPIVDDQYHAVVVPVGREVRVAGTAEFSGYNHEIVPARIRNLFRLLGEVLPQREYNLTQGKAWCGLRAMSADGVPLIGSLSIPNLLVNTGHGHLGWTMAAGSGDLLASVIAGEKPAIDDAPYAPGRFGMM